MFAMTSDSKPTDSAQQPDAIQHVAEAHRILRALQLPLDKHPDLAKAIDNLEMALSILTTKTGGML
jgi:predicted component of type VI protein secretion system